MCIGVKRSQTLSLAQAWGQFRDFLWCIVTEYQFLWHLVLSQPIAPDLQSDGLCFLPAWTSAPPCSSAVALDSVVQHLSAPDLP